jgi:hypothetical protein
MLVQGDLAQPHLRHFVAQGPGEEALSLAAGAGRIGRIGTCMKG